MFPLLVEEQLDFWPEKNARQRIWVSTNCMIGIGCRVLLITYYLKVG
jgi:hypothetical protein